MYMYILQKKYKYIFNLNEIKFFFIKLNQYLYLNPHKLSY